MRGSSCNHYRIDWAQYKDFVINGTLITKWLKSGESDPIAVAKDTRSILFIGYFEGATLKQESYCYYQALVDHHQCHRN